MPRGMDIVEKLKAAFSKDHRGVELAYLFGSRATGRGARRRPDIDVGVLFSRTRRSQGLEIAVTRVRLALEEAFPGDEVDLLVLNDAGPILRHEVIACGFPVYARSLTRRIDVESRWLDEYCDLEPLRRLNWQALRKSLGMPYDRTVL
jgi:predicted nucleotidyltransferase